MGGVWDVLCGFPFTVSDFPHLFPLLFPSFSYCLISHDTPLAQQCQENIDGNLFMSLLIPSLPEYL
jgi:hypothetical protein